jgi:hypothetical protein
LPSPVARNGSGVDRSGPQETARSESQLARNSRAEGRVRRSQALERREGPAARRHSHRDEPRGARSSQNGHGRTLD